MATHCPQKHTAIDHLTIEFSTKSKTEFQQLKTRLYEYLREHHIRIGSKGPHTLGQFTDGNLLHSALTTSNKKTKGSIKYLPAKNRLKLELNGAQCALIELSAQRFCPLIHLAQTHNGIIRRIDIYYDDFTGRFDIRRTQKDVAKGLYKPNTGPKPQVSYIGRPAQTMYIGSLKSSKFMRIYRKYLEQKLPSTDPLYGYWYRHEMVLKNQGKTVIPLLALRQSDGLFLGEYPKAHRKFIENTKPMNMQRIVAKQVACGIAAKTRYVKRQAGRLINLLDELVVDDSMIINGIKRPGLPQGIELPKVLDRRVLKQEVTAMLLGEQHRQGATYAQTK